MQLMQMRPRSSKNSNSILYSPGNQQLRLRLDLKMGGVSSNLTVPGARGEAPCAETAYF